MAGWTTLVQAETLSIALGRADLAIIDCRFSLVNPGAGELAYQQGHLPGAVYAHLDRDLSDHRKRDQGRHPWPDAADFTAKLGAWGITPRHQVRLRCDHTVSGRRLTASTSSHGPSSTHSQAM